MVVTFRENTTHHIIDVESHHDKPRCEQTFTGREPEGAYYEIDPSLEFMDKDYELTGYDILCGRCKQAFNHYGNRRFRVTISIFLKKYLEQSSRVDRSILILNIVDLIRECGGHFLRREGDRWVDIGDKEARNKVGHALRDAASVAKAKAKSQQNVAKTIKSRPIPTKMKQLLTAVEKHEKQQAEAIITEQAGAAALMSKNKTKKEIKSIKHQFQSRPPQLPRHYQLITEKQLPMWPTRAIDSFTLFQRTFVDPTNRHLIAGYINQTTTPSYYRF